MTSATDIPGTDKAKTFSTPPLVDEEPEEEDADKRPPKAAVVPAKPPRVASFLSSKSVSREEDPSGTTAIPQTGFPNAPTSPGQEGEHSAGSKHLQDDPAPPNDADSVEVIKPLNPMALGAKPKTKSNRKMQNETGSSSTKNMMNKYANKRDKKKKENSNEADKSNLPVFRMTPKAQVAALTSNPEDVDQSSNVSVAEDDTNNSNQHQQEEEDLLDNMELFSMNPRRRRPNKRLQPKKVNPAQIKGLTKEEEEKLEKAKVEAEERKRTEDEARKAKVQKAIEEREAKKSQMEKKVGMSKNVQIERDLRARAVGHQQQEEEESEAKPKTEDLRQRLINGQKIVAYSIKFKSHSYI